MKAICLLVAVSVVSLSGQSAPPQPQTHRETLAADTVIQGYPCAAGYIWRYADGRLERCALSRETAFGQATLPAESIIVPDADGTPRYAQPAHDIDVAGVRCQGGNRVLGPSEGSMVTFYPNGKLQLCFLAGDQTVQGVPCRTAGTMGFGGDGAQRNGGARFNENGKLRSCTLASAYGGQKKGDHFELR